MVDSDDALICYAVFAQLFAFDAQKTFFLFAFPMTPFWNRLSASEPKEYNNGTQGVIRVIKLL